MNQRLEHGLQMPRRKIVPRGELARRQRILARVKRDIDNGGNGQETLAGQKRHGAGNQVGTMILGKLDQHPQELVQRVPVEPKPPLPRSV